MEDKIFQAALLVAPLCLTDLCLFPVLWVVVQSGFWEGVESRKEGFGGWFAGGPVEILPAPPPRVHSI